MRTTAPTVRQTERPGRGHCFAAPHPPRPGQRGAAAVRRSSAGFTLAEVLVVVVLLGVLATIVATKMSSSWQKSRLQSSAGQVKALIQSAYDETTQIHAPVFVRFTPAADGGGTFQLAQDAAGTQLLDELSVPSYIVFSTSAVGLAEGNWPAEDGSALGASSTATRVLECDLIGRTLNPAGTQVTGAQQLVLTHRSMVTGSLTPPFRYVLALSPLWHVQVTRETF